MPSYTYRCTACPATDTRLGALDDHQALCLACGGVMVREDLDVLAPYFELHPDCPWCVGPTPEGASPISHKICARHARELREG